MTKQQKKEMIDFFLEMDAKMEAKEKKQQQLAERNPEFPMKKASMARKKMVLQTV